MKLRKKSLYISFGTVAMILAVLLLWPAWHSLPGGVQQEIVRRDLQLIYTALEAYSSHDGGKYPSDIKFVSELYATDNARVQRVLSGKYLLNPALHGSTWGEIQQEQWVASTRSSKLKMLIVPTGKVVAH